VTGDARGLTVLPAHAVSPIATCDAFNVSFSDYLISFPKLDEDGWRTFVRRQGIDLSLSSVACRDDKVVAFAMVTPRPFGRTRIAVMGARPDERGSGAAARLLDREVAASAARGDRWIELEAFAQNERAVRLYRSRGFEVVAELYGYAAAPGTGMAPDVAARTVSVEDASRWVTAFDEERPAWLPWQAGGEAIVAAVDCLEVERLGAAQLVIRKPDAETAVVASLIDRDDAQGDATRLLGRLRQRYPDRTLRAPQLQRRDGAARAFEAAGWTREPLFQFFMRRPPRPTPAASPERG